jgi:hypothetical protein
MAVFYSSIVFREAAVKLIKTGRCSKVSEPDANTGLQSRLINDELTFDPYTIFIDLSCSVAYVI